jgi:hypothetical protein
VNGSFESTSGTCSYGLTNSGFTGAMTDCFAFGSASQIDILNGTCGYGAAQHGNFFIGLAVDINNTLTDALSLKLNTPLVAGNSYQLSFYNKKDGGYNTNVLEVGYSTDSVLFGTSIGTAPLPTTTWGLVSFSFTPIVNSQFLTVRTIAGSYGWNFIDNFTITETTEADKQPIEEQKVTVYPNPASGFISIQPNFSCKVITTTIRDAQGKTVLITDKSTIDLSALSPGVFIAEINTDKGRVIKRILLK